jgi:hypothetical protein
MTQTGFKNSFLIKRVVLLNRDQTALEKGFGQNVNKHTREREQAASKIHV